MTSQEAVYARFPATRRLIVQLEADIANWQNVIHAPGKQLATEEFYRALNASGSLEAQLAELRQLLATWEAQRERERIPLTTHLLVGAAALYMVLMAVVIFYLITVARG